jgi:putative ABC transport system permease protein
MPRAIASIGQAFRTHFPGNPFEYFFLDEYFAAQYEADRTFGELFRIFAGLAIFIACLGLFGLSAFVTVRRTREIGIRKVNGATARDIVTLLIREFITPVVIGFAIAVPVTFIVLQRWLETYAFRTNMSPGTYLVAGATVFVVALVSVIHSSTRVARMRPVEALKND